MQLSKRETIALFVLLGFLSLFAIASPVVGQTDSYPDKYSHQEQAQEGPSAYEAEDLRISWLDLKAQWTMAVGTLALFVLTLLTLRTANRTAAEALAASEKAFNAAAEANKLTKQSVEAYIDTERGDLRLEGARISDDEGQIMWSYINKGRGPVFVRLFAVSFGRLALTGGITWEQHFPLLLPETVSVNPEDRFTSGGINGAPQSHTAGPLAISLGAKSTFIDNAATAVAIQLKIVYATQVRRHLYTSEQDTLYIRVFGKHLNTFGPPREKVDYTGTGGQTA